MIKTKQNNKNLCAWEDIGCISLKCKFNLVDILWLHNVINWIMHPNLHVKVLIPNVNVSGHRAFKEMIEVKWGHKNRALIQ